MLYPEVKQWAQHVSERNQRLTYSTTVKYMGYIIRYLALSTDGDNY